MCLLGCSFTYAAEEQFNDALNAANSGNTALLDQYQLAMQNDVLGYYPEYWKLNTNLGFQPTASIVSFAQRYPQSAMAEKLAADYVEEKLNKLTLHLLNLSCLMLPTLIKPKIVLWHRCGRKAVIH